MPHTLFFLSVTSSSSHDKLQNRTLTGTSISCMRRIAFSEDVGAHISGRRQTTTGFGEGDCKSGKLWNVLSGVTYTYLQHAAGLTSNSRGRCCFVASFIWL